nr:unnamed protein product [Callosobruchus analis]
MLIHQNLQSIGNSVEKIENFLYEHPECRFICATEHWKSEEELMQIGILDFNLASYFCREHGKHGGSAIFCKSGIIFKSLTNIVSLSILGEFECSAVQITSGLYKFIIVSLCGPCNGSLITFFRQFELLINIVTKNVNFVFIAGDFNIKLKDENSTKTDLEILIQSYGMRLLINDYTRVTVSKKSCIDNIITNYEHNCITDTIDPHTLTIGPSLCYLALRIIQK